MLWTSMRWESDLLDVEGSTCCQGKVPLAWSLQLADQSQDFMLYDIENEES